MARTKKKKVVFASEDKINGFEDHEDRYDSNADALNDLGDLSNPSKLSKPIRTVQVPFITLYSLL